MQYAIENTQTSKTQRVSGSRKRIWTGRIMSGFIMLFMLFDCVTHFIRTEQVRQAFAQLGIPIELSVVIAAIQLVCLILYVIPKTSVLGAVLFTGYLGGAVWSLLLIGQPVFSHVLFPVYFGIILWGGIYLRDDSLRRVFPLRREESIF